MSRKGENIYKRKDGRWEGRFVKARNFDGKAMYGYVYGKTYRETKAKLIDKASGMRNAETKINKSTPYLFKNITEEWIKALTPQIKESTRNKYLNLLDSYILPALGESSLDEITHGRIENMCNTLLLNGGVNKTGLSSKTVTDVLSVIRSVLQYATQLGQIVPYDAKTIHIKCSSKEMRVFSRSEQEKLCNYLYTDICPCHMGILVSLFTGLRLGEICALRWEDISLSDQTIHVHRTMQRIQNKSNEDKKTKIIITTPKSSCSVRTIPVPDDLSQIIAAYKTTDTGFFLSNSNQPFLEPRTMQNKFKRVLENCSIDPANYHSLRHTFATRCVELGFDVKTLSEILGHASVNITMNRYVHPTLELKKENMQKLSSLLAVK